jgi:DNA polymerase-1
MDEIRDKETGVLIPAGSNSLRIERAVEPITAEMNETPLRVNRRIFEKNLAHATKLWEELRDITRRMTGRENFRPNASADCVEELFGRRALPVQKVSKKTGQPTCDSDVLLALAARNGLSSGDDLAPAIIKARKARAILSQFEKFAPFAKAGFVQTKWNQYGTPMARFSSSAPNLQSRVLEIREVVEADEGWSFVTQDLGQSEYVVWASLSNDPTLSEAFLAGEDFHQKMYEKLKDVFAAQGIDNGRKSGKTVNFSLLYLMKPFSFSRRMGISQEAAQNIFDEYEAIASKAIAYREGILEAAARNGLSRISTRFGRTRFLRDLGSKDKSRRDGARKTAWHHHNAGTAAELMKIKMVKTWKGLRAEGLENDRVRVALNMHDEMILKVRDDVVDRVAEIAKEKFLEPIDGFLPIAVDQRIGKTWGAISK